MPGVKWIELVVVAAVLVSLPSLAEAFDGGISLATALIRLALGLVVCGAVGAIVERTLSRYAREARQKEIERRIAKALAVARGQQWPGSGSVADGDLEPPAEGRP